MLQGQIFSAPLTVLDGVEGSETWRHDRVTMTVWGAVVRAHVPRPLVFHLPTVTRATLSRPQPLREGGSGGRRPSRTSTQDTSHLLTLLYCEYSSR